MYLEELFRIIQRNDEGFLRALLAYAIGREKSENKKQDQ